MFWFSEVCRSLVVSYYTRTDRIMDSPRLASPHGASSPKFCSKQSQLWIQTRLPGTLSRWQYLQGQGFHSLAIKSAVFLPSQLLCPAGTSSDSCYSCYLMVQLCTEPGSGSTLTSPRGLADGSSVFPKPSLFLAKPALFPQPRSLGHVFLLSQKSWEIIFSLIIILVSF